jgi:uncharacterized peroxidase-related enzyme
VVHHGEALARESGDASLTETVVSGSFQRLAPRLAAMCEYALKLTSVPDEMREQDLARLRGVGLTDRGIVDLNQVVSYYNYVNRVADGLGVELEDSWPEEVRRERRYGLVARRPPSDAAG